MDAVASASPRVLTLKVNGQERMLLVEPRTHLADALREQLNLTGTHLGCEQGVCGACTVLIDGVPQRSCIAYAVDCEVRPSSWLRVAPPKTARNDWTTVDLPAGREYVAALAIEGEVTKVDVLRLKLLP